MTTPNNTLQIVNTFNMANIGYLQNMFVVPGLWNKEFIDFNTKIVSNLGSSVTFSLQVRGAVANTLVANFQGIVQRPMTLTCDNAFSYAYDITEQERIFNLEKPAFEYMKLVGESATMNLGSSIESNALLDITGTRPVMTQVGNQTVPTGALHTEAGPVTFFGDGITDLTSYQQIEQAYQNFAATGIDNETWVVLPNIKVPPIINSGLAQFAVNRNNQIADSWEIMKVGTVKYVRSNLIQPHISGNVGNAAGSGSTLTVVSTNDPTGANITQITFSGATASDANAILPGDIFGYVVQSSYSTPYRRTFYGNVPTTQIAQNRVASATAADGSGNVTVTLAMPFQSSGIVNGTVQSITQNIVAGMKFKFVPTHLPALMCTGRAAYLAMPRLRDQAPYQTSVVTDKKSGLSMRMYNGAQFGQNLYGWVNDCVSGSTIIPEYSQRLVFTIS